MTDTPVRGWREAVGITIDNSDTTTPRDLFLLVRRNGNFMGDTLSLAVDTFTPDSLHFCERADFPVLRTRRAAALRDVVRIPYRRRAILRRQGCYRIAFTPLGPVDGIEAVGIDLVKSE